MVPYVLGVNIKEGNDYRLLVKMSMLLIPFTREIFLIISRNLAENLIWLPKQWRKIIFSNEHNLQREAS